MRKLYKTNYGVASPLEFSIASIALMTTLVVVAASMAPPAEQGSAQIHADANAKATEIMSLLLTSDSQVGLAIDPETPVPVPPTGSISDITILNSCPTVQNPSPGDGDSVPLNPNPPNSVDLSVYVSDIDKGDVMKVSFYDVTSGDGEFIDVDVDVESGTRANVTWSGLSEGEEYRWYVTVDDSTCNITSETWTFTTSSNSAPHDPEVPKWCFVEVQPHANKSYCFWTFTEDLEGNDIYFKWDWDDGTQSDWVGPYPSSGICTMYHSWCSPGIYSITVKAKDDPDGNGDLSDGKESSWSEPLQVMIRVMPPNDPPNQPNSPDGPDTTKVGKVEMFRTHAEDPDGDDIYFKWDFDDGNQSDWVGPYSGKGEYCYINYSWSTAGTYYITVKAADDPAGNGHNDSDPHSMCDGKESPWSSHHTILVSGGEEGETGKCFLAGTKILMADATQKHIEEIQIGDIVKSYNEKTGTLTKDKVIQIFHDTPNQMISDYYLIVNNHLKVTPDHLLYINNEWIQAGNLKLGDHLFKGKVTSLEKIYEKAPSYNLEIEKYHTYLVVFGDNIVIAHNVRKYILTGNEEEISLSRQNSVTENDYTALLSMDKIYELSEVPYQELKEIFSISDEYEFFIKIENSESIFLNIMPDQSISSGQVKVKCLENIIIADSAGFAYATITVAVVR